MSDPYNMADDAPPPPYHAAGPQQLGYADAGVLQVYDNSGRASLASKLLLVYALLLGVSSVLGVLALLTVPSFRNGGFPPPGGSTTAAAEPLRLVFIVVNGLVAFAAFVLFVLAVIFYMRWQYRAVANARATGHDTRHSPGWGVGWWFIPVANLFVPRRVLRDLWRVSGAGERRGSREAGGLPSTIYLLWLVFNLLSLVGILVNGYAGARVGYAIASGAAKATPGSPPTLPPGLNFQGYYLTAMGLNTVAGILAIGFYFLLARYVTAVQEAQAEE